MIKLGGLMQGTRIVNKRIFMTNQCFPIETSFTQDWSVGKEEKKLEQSLFVLKNKNNQYLAWMDLWESLKRK